MKSLAFAALLLATTTLPAQKLLVISKQEHALAVVDGTALKILGKAPTGDDPHEVTASADGRTAWVSNYGFGSLHTLTPIDLATIKALPPIDLGALTGPHGLTFVGGKVWFTAEGAKSLGRFDPATGKVDLILGTGQNRTHMIYVAPDQEHIVTTNVSSGTVSIIDKEELHMPGPPPGGGGPGGNGRPGPPPGGQPGPRKDWTETVVKVGNGSEGFDVSPDRSQIWVANAQDGTISVIDYASKRVIDTLKAGVVGANRLQFTHDGKLVLVSTLGGSDLVVLDAHTRNTIKRIPIGHGAAGIVVEPNDHRAFVACTADDYVAVIDLPTLTLTTKLHTGGGPDGMTWIPAP